MRNEIAETQKACTHLAVPVCDMAAMTKVIERDQEVACVYGQDFRNLRLPSRRRAEKRASPRRDHFRYTGRK